MNFQPPFNPNSASTDPAKSQKKFVLSSITVDMAAMSVEESQFKQQQQQQQRQRCSLPTSQLIQYQSQKESQRFSSLPTFKSFNYSQNVKSPPAALTSKEINTFNQGTSSEKSDSGGVDGNSVAGKNSCKCLNESHENEKELSSYEHMSTEYYQQKLDKFRGDAIVSGNDAAKINGHLNEIFLKRLKDIDRNAQPDVSDLKLIIYQEWVDMLLTINETVINNMEDLETEISESLQKLKCHVKEDAEMEGGHKSELLSLKKDMKTLMEVIKNCYRYNNWDLKDYKFETVTLSEVLGLTGDQVYEDSEKLQQNKKVRSNHE